MSEVSNLRLYLLRATYLLVAVGLGLEIWPLMLHHQPWDLMHGVACSLLSAVAVLALAGVRHPLQMLPILLFELLWKSIWLVAIALPAWSAHQIDAGMRQTVLACLMGIIFPVVMPWRYIVTHYVLKPGDRWSGRAGQGMESGT